MWKNHLAERIYFDGWKWKEHVIRNLVTCNTPTSTTLAKPFYCEFPFFIEFLFQKYQKSFSRPPTAEIQPPEVPEITLNIKQHDSAHHAKLSHDIPREKNELNKYTKSRLVVVGPTTKTGR